MTDLAKIQASNERLAEQRDELEALTHAARLMREAADVLQRVQTSDRTRRAARLLIAAFDTLTGAEP